MQTFRVTKAARRDHIMCAIASLLLGACLSVDLVANAMTGV